MRKVVLDTNVLVAALRSRRGASFYLLSFLGQQRFLTCVSVALMLEYEDVLNRSDTLPDLGATDIDALLDYLCLVSLHQQVHFLWRPFLKDPQDDMLLELAVAAEGASIITFNVRDFKGTEQFGIEILTPFEFLKTIGEKP